MRVIAILTFLFGFSPLLLLAGASTRPGQLQGLLDNSPFGRNESTLAGTPSINQPLEFRAVLAEGNRMFFSIFDTVTHRSTWVSKDETCDDFIVRDYDEAKISVTLEYRGRELVLSLKRAGPSIPPPALSAASAPREEEPRTHDTRLIPKPFDRVKYLQMLEELHRDKSASRSIPVSNLPPVSDQHP